MNAFDGIMLVVLVAFTLIGALRGFVRETLSLILWPLAALVAWVLADVGAALFEGLIDELPLRTVAAFVLIFGLTFVLGTVVIHLVHRVLPLRGMLRKPNTLLGGLAGLLRGAIIIVIVFLVAGITSLPQRPWWQESSLAPHFERFALTISAYIPRDIARHLRFS